MHSGSQRENTPLLRNEALSVNNDGSILNQLNELIALLEAEEKSLEENLNNPRYKYYINTVLCLFTIICGASQSAVMLAVMIIVMNNMHDELMPELTQHLNDLLSKLDVFKKDLNALETAHDQIKVEAHALDIKYGQPLIDQWVEGYPTKDSCWQWHDENGQVKNLNEVFPDMTNDYCWFQEHGEEHPLAKCKELSEKLCEVDKTYPILHEDQELKAEILAKKGDVYAVQHEIDETNAKINTITPEPVTTTVFAATTAIAIGAIFYMLRTWLNVRKEYAKALEATQIKNFLKQHPQYSGKVADITKKLNLNTDNMTLSTLIKFLRGEQAKRSHRYRFVSSANIPTPSLKSNQINRPGLKKHSR